jgi:hypothetical protein
LREEKEGHQLALEQAKKHLQAHEDEMSVSAAEIAALKSNLASIVKEYGAAISSAKRVREERDTALLKCEADRKAVESQLADRKALESQLADRTAALRKAEEERKTHLKSYEESRKALELQLADRTAALRKAEDDRKTQLKSAEESRKAQVHRLESELADCSAALHRAEEDRKAHLEAVDRSRDCYWDGHAAGKYLQYTETQQANEQWREAFEADARAKQQISSRELVARLAKQEQNRNNELRSNFLRDEGRLLKENAELKHRLDQLSSVLKIPPQLPHGAIKNRTCSVKTYLHASSRVLFDARRTQAFVVGSDPIDILAVSQKPILAALNLALFHSERKK